MKKIEVKVFENAKSFSFSDAQNIIGNCSLLEVELIKYREHGYSNVGIPYVAYTPITISHGYVWKSLAGDCWLKAELENTAIQIGFAHEVSRGINLDKELEFYKTLHEDKELLECVPKNTSEYPYVVSRERK